MASKEQMSDHHNFKWGSKGPGHGVGECRYCGAKIVFRKEGSRGGLVRRFKSAKATKWSDTMPTCKAHPVTAVVATAAKSVSRKKSKKNGAKRGAAKRTAKKSAARRSAPKKRSAKKVSAPAQEAAST